MEATPQPEQGSVTLDVERAIARVSLARPSKLNALDLGMVGRLTDVFGELAARDDVRAVVLSGRGRAFCAGADIGDYDEHTEASFLAFQSAFRGMCESVERIPAPVIAAVHGYVLGAGLILANSCDLVVAAEDAQLGLPEIKIGLFGGGPRITQLLTRHQAAELMMLGDPVPAADALRLGIVNRVVPASSVATVAEELAGELTTRAPLALAAIKRYIQGSDEASLGVRMDMERAVLGYLFATEDAREGVRAFMQKRPANFRGR
jgi:enoyl-CoA hydratase/carnithine racemase